MSYLKQPDALEACTDGFQIADVLEIHDYDGGIRFWRVDSIGFTELELDSMPDNSGQMPHETPLLA